MSTIPYVHMHGPKRHENPQSFHLVRPCMHFTCSSGPCTARVCSSFVYAIKQNQCGWSKAISSLPIAKCSLSLENYSASFLSFLTLLHTCAVTWCGDYQVLAATFSGGGKAAKLLLFFHDYPPNPPLFFLLILSFPCGVKICKVRTSFLSTFCLRQSIHYILSTVPQRHSCRHSAHTHVHATSHGGASPFSPLFCFLLKKKILTPFPRIYSHACQSRV